jgi:hypothetical protein
MNADYGAGAVWWRLIDFGDGKGEVRKYFVLLTDDAGDGNVIVAMTTSKGDDRYSDARSPSPCAPSGKCYRVDANQEKCFHLDTWIQFDNAALVRVADLKGLAIAGKGGFLQPLDEGRLRSMLGCAKKSHDIPTRDLERIDKALKARAPVKRPPTPPPGPAPKAPPAFVNSEILFIGVQVKKLCDDCRSDFCGMLGVTSDSLTAILHGAEQAPKDFVADATIGIEALKTERSSCARCAK